MKKHNKIRIFLSTCLVALATVFCGVLVSTAPVKAEAAETKLSATEFKTDGASVRVFKKLSDETLETTDKTGIRFHVEMGAGYSVNGTPLLDTTDTKTNANGAYKMAEGYKTYTLVTPTSLLNGAELTLENMATVKAQKIETTGYWFSDSDGNWESVAYIYNIPLEKRTQQFTFRGVIVSVADDGTETPVAYTTVNAETDTRHIAFVAKHAYDDTIDANSNYWGTVELDETAAPLIKKFIPSYSITYNVNGVETEEEVLWGDTPKSAPTVQKPTGGHVEKTAAWYDTTNNEEVDVSKAMDWTTDRTLTLMSSASAEFKLTGIADYNNFTPKDTAYSGAKVYATVPAKDFYTEDEIANASKKMIEIDVKAVNVEHQGNGTFGGLQGVWTLLEGSQMRLVFAFDSSTLKSGDKIIIKGDSVFYANNVMYKLTEDYTIDYTLNGEAEDYGMFLGYLHNSDIKLFENWDEYRDGTRVRIRITFYDDLLINSDFTFVYDGALPEGYTYPVYTKCGDTKVETQITEGYYYWNDGEHTILELEGYAYHNNDELFGVPGVKIVQNGGYYIFEDAMYAYYNGTEWVVGAEKGTFGKDAFEWKGTNYTTGTQEVRFTTNTNTALKAGGTTDRWFDAVRALHIENMSDEPYAVYATAPDGTVTEIKEFMYHGQDTDTAYNHIFAFKGYIGTEAGETLTIVEGTRFWYGSEYFTATENIVFYFNGEYWILNHNGTEDYTIGVADFTGQNFNFFEVGINKMRMVLVNEQFGGATGALVLESGSVKVNDTSYTSLVYHGNGNKLLEIKGDSTTPIGVNALRDTLVIEAGTRVWLNNLCLEFTETIEWIFIGEGVLKDGSGNPMNYHWVSTNNMDITVADITSVYNATDAGGEVRFKLRDGILTDTFYAFAYVDTSKGIPVVNGVEKPHYAFSYNMNNDLIAVRGGEYGTKLGDYIIIPKGSVWWTTQGSLTFTEEIYAVWSGEWFFGFNTNSNLGEIDNQQIMAVRNEGDDEIRVQIPLGISDTYYGPLAITEGACITKADGTKVDSVFGYWYGGASGTYKADHSLIGFRGTGIAGATEGDVFTVKAGAKMIFRTASGVEGYRTFTEDLVYTYVDNAWQAGDLTATATYTVNSNATVSGVEDAIIGKTYEFNVTPDAGYVVESVTINGNAVALNETNTYSFVADKTNDIDITIVEGYLVTFVIPETATVNGGAITSGMLKAVAKNGSFTFAVAAKDGYRIKAVTNTADNSDGTYTVSPTADTTIEITTIKQWTLTYSITNASVKIAELGNQAVSGNGSVVVDEGTYTVTVTANSGYGISSVTGATSNGNGTYTATVNSDLTVSVVASKYTVTATTIGGVSVDAASKSVAHGSNVTFTLTVPTGATIKANGTVISGTSYTVNNVTADTTVEFTTWYTATVNAGNTTISGVTNNELYATNTNLSFTVTANAGYLLTGVTANGEAPTVNNGSYSYTVTGNVTIATTTVALTDISDTISIENWVEQNGADNTWFAIKANSNDYIFAAAEMQNKYWNDQADNIKVYNYGVDIMDYIYINGVSARQLVTQNASSNQYTGTTFPFSASGVYAPVTVETGDTGSAGVWIRVMTAYATEVEVTVKAGFLVAGADGTNYYMSKDATIFYADGRVGQEENDLWIGTTKASVSGVTDGQKITYGQTYNFTATPDTGYNLSSVKINDVEYGTSGSYSYTASNVSATIIVTTTPKIYKATVSASNATVSGLTNNQDIAHDQTYNFTVAANSGYQLTSVTINGTEQGAGGSYSFTASGTTSIVVTAKKLYTVTASCSGGVSVSNTPQTVVEGGSVTFNLNVPSEATIKANGTQISGTTHTVSNVTANTTVTFTTWYAVTVTSLTEGSVKVDGTIRSVNWSQLVESGKTITVQATYSQEDDRKCTAGSESWSDENSHTVTVEGKKDITVYSKKSCLVEGTMVLMADGTQKAVENIVAGDKVMVFNHETGKYEAGTIWFNDHADEPAKLSKVINLEFANGAKARLAYEHGYFDLDLMKYVFIRGDNMHEFIGHRFVTSTYNGTEVVQSETTLVKAYITEEVVKVYGPITEYHFNLVTDDMLSMPSFNFDAMGMVNIFEYDEDLTYNEEKMQADIDTYGLFTYEEFSAYMSYEDYCKAPIQYFKVAIGKGNLTWEQIELTLQYLAVNEF